MRLPLESFFMGDEYKKLIGINQQIESNLFPGPEQIHAGAFRWLQLSCLRYSLKHLKTK